MFKNYGNTNFITGLRAIAATMVVIIHTSAFKDFGWIGKNITWSGLGGVYVFFVIAGFSVTQSYQKEASFKTYLLRRMARIIPAYYVAITVTLLLVAYGLIKGVEGGLHGTPEYNFYNLAMHYLFISYFDASIANSILFVEWTLPIEVFWYLALPLLLATSKRWRILFVWFAITAILPDITKGLLKFAEIPSNQIEFMWVPTKYGYYFVLGVITHKFRAECHEKWPDILTPMLILGLSLFVLNVVLSVGNTPKFLGIATFLVICGYTGQFVLLSRILENKVMLFLGGISYSLYLLHYPIIRLVGSIGVEAKSFTGFLIVFPLTVLAAFVMTRFFEIPIYRYASRHIIRKMT